jgi:hypothetical protein
LANAVNASIADGQGQGTILNDDFNTPPSCSGGGPYASTCRTASINGATASDPDGDLLSFSWTSSNPNVTLSPANALSTTATLGSAVNPCNQSATLTLTVSDGKAGTCTSTATVTFNDTTPPTISDVADAVVECTGSTAPSATGEPTANDTCGTVTVTHTDGTMSDQCGNTGSFVRTWKVTDACGNEATSQQTITIVDTTAPSISDVPDAIVECTGSTDPSATGEPTGSDTCGSVSISHNDSFAGACGNSGVITRTWTATDACGNTAQSTQLITVVDTTAPVLAGCPADTTVECDAVLPAATPTATDNCDSTPTITLSETSTKTSNGSCSDQNYIITRTWTATDACGNAVFAARRSRW